MNSGSIDDPIRGRIDRLAEIQSKSDRLLAAENGATVNQLMALFDWDTPGQAKIYTDAADRKRMAGEAMCMLDRRK